MQLNQYKLKDEIGKVTVILKAFPPFLSPSPPLLHLTEIIKASVVLLFCCLHLLRCMTVLISTFPANPRQAMGELELEEEGCV